MYQYIFDEKATEKIKDSTNKAKSILEQFAEVDDKYTFGDKMDIGLDLKRNDYVAPSQAEVEEKAKNSLESYKKQIINSINDNFQKKSEKIDEDIKSTKINSKIAKDEIKNTYAKVKENASNDAIKRGLARSSIVVNTLSNYDNKMLNDLEVLASKTSEELASLDTQKNTLELQKENALNDFNIEYAVKLQSEIDSINSDIAKAQESALKYNNEIAELEAKWAKEQNQENYDRQSDLLELISKYGSYAITIAKENEKYSLARQHFANMDKQTALNELKNNSAYLNNLGTANFKKLLEELSAS